MGAEELNDLVSDFTRFYILTILYEGPTHGYGILRKFKRKLGKTISPGLVYPFLQNQTRKYIQKSFLDKLSKFAQIIYTLHLHFE